MPRGRRVTAADGATVAADGEPWATACGVSHNVVLGNAVRGLGNAARSALCNIISIIYVGWWKSVVYDLDLIYLAWHTMMTGGKGRGR